MKKLNLLFASFLLAAASSANAGIITINDSVDGQTVSAEADYTFSTNTLTITLTNLLSNPTSVSQAISGLNFTVEGGLTGTLTSATGELVTVDDDGVVTSLGNETLDWLQGPGFYTTALGSNGPDQTILGQPNAFGVYSNANGSIANNKPHNPFVRYQAILIYAIPGATSSSNFAEFAMLFGTKPTSIGGDIPPGGGDPGEVPEPAAMALMGGGLSALFFVNRFRRRKAD